MNKGVLLPLMITFLVLASWCLPVLARAQDGASLHQVQAVVDGLSSTRHAYRADELLRMQPGVVMSRTDLNTSNLYLQVTPDCALDQAVINTLLSPIGLSVRCLRREEAGTAPFRHLGTGPCPLEQDAR